MTDDRKIRLTLPSSEPAYKVGYRKPPAESQFKPGRSGNPRGRPKGARNKLPALNEEDVLKASSSKRPTGPSRSLRANDR